MPPATASRSFARQNAPVVSHSYPRTPIVRPLLTQQPAPFPNVANGSLYIHPFDSEKTPCPLLQSILTVKTLFHRPACAQKRFAPPAPNSAIKARFHRPDYAKKHPKHLSSASKSLLQSAPCSAHRKKHEKTRPFAPSNRLSLTDTTKEKLARSPSQATYSPRRSSPSPHDNKQSKEKAEAMPPFKLFSRHSATIGKKQKRIPSPPQLKKTRRNRSPRRPTTNRENAATGHTPPNRAFIFQPRLCRPLRFFCAALLQILCTALKPLKCHHTKRVEKTFNKKLIPRRKCRTLLTRNRPQTQTHNKKRERKHPSRKTHKKKKAVFADRFPFAEVLTD